MTAEEKEEVEELVKEMPPLQRQLTLEKIKSQGSLHNLKRRNSLIQSNSVLHDPMSVLRDKNGLIVCSVNDDDEPGTPVLYTPVGKTTSHLLENEKLQDCKVLVTSQKKPPLQVSSVAVQTIPTRNVLTQTENEDVNSFSKELLKEANAIEAKDKSRSGRV